MARTIIRIENLGKEYRLGLVSTRTLSHDINRWWKMNILGRDDPYLKIGELNDRISSGSGEYIWALKDINLDVQEGEVLGIIGKNGAGKSTLLKILSKVTTPSTGMVKANGRIASLLEVGTGFHQEMTGRENIFLNGAILGMNKAEIKRKFDEIVDFSGVSRYIDTPVKRYSSGMLVRLGFAVAAHLEPEILIIDEILAVGDAEFQKKALGKMEDVSRNEGRTVLFVSHNMGSVARLCTKGILLKNGILAKTGQVNEIIETYLNEESFRSGQYCAADDACKPVQILSVRISNHKGAVTEKFSIHEPVYLEIVLKNSSVEKGIRCNVGVWDAYGSLITMERLDIPVKSDCIVLKGKLKEDVLLANKYRLTLALDIPNVRVIELLPRDFVFEIFDTVGLDISKSGDTSNGLIKSFWSWN